MFRISARSRFLNLQHSFKMFYVLAVGAFVSILSFVLYHDFVVAFIMILCTIVSYILLARPPKDIVIEMTDDGVTIDEVLVKWGKCITWAMVDLGDTLEFVIQSTDVTHQFYYFYISEKQPGIKEFILRLTQYLPYDETIPSKNFIHNALRWAGLK